MGNIISYMATDPAITSYQGDKKTNPGTHKNEHSGCIVNGSH